MLAMLVAPARVASRLGARVASRLGAPLSSAATPVSSVYAAPASPANAHAPASPANAHAWVALEYVYAARDAAELATKRAPLRVAHLAHAAAAPALALGGAFAPSSTAPAAQGGLLLFRTADAAAVERFARSDPYFTGGLVASFTVRPWTVVIDKRA